MSDERAPIKPLIGRGLDDVSAWIAVSLPSYKLNLDLAAYL